MAASTVGGLLINLLGINPIDALFWTAVINGFLAPPLLAIIMLVGGNKAIMGKQANGRGAKALGWSTTLLMFAAAVGLLVTWGAS
jgi:Mn2+/Fe2+ NRAMP family transporter